MKPLLDADQVIEVARAARQNQLITVHERPLAFD
jgi:hypothetical protein